MICGMNNLGVYEDYPYDYFFSYNGSIWGWASWKRVVGRWNDKYELLNSDDGIKRFIGAGEHKIDIKKYIAVAKRHMASGRAHYESIMAYDMLTNNTINIVPTKNMISNIGNNCNTSTHSASDEKYVPKGIRQILSMKRYNLIFPIKHPPFVMEEVGFKVKFNRIMAIGHPLVKMYRRIEAFLLALRYGNIKLAIHKIKKLFRIEK